MTIKQFIDKAIKGGWSNAEHLNLRIVNTTLGSVDMPLTCVFLDPLAWKAVGRIEGWEDCNGTSKINHREGKLQLKGCHGNCWFVNMHCMISTLADGRTIEEFIETL